MDIIFMLHVVWMEKVLRDQMILFIKKFASDLLRENELFFTFYIIYIL